MNMIVEVACASRCGKIRGNNEDNLLLDGKILSVTGGDLWPPEGFEKALTGQETMAVFDGMGGEANGEIASSAAAISFRDQLSGRAVEDYELFSVLQKINAAVFQKGQELQSERMGTTMVSLTLSPEKAVCANLGDSPLFILRSGKLQKISKDHTDAEEMQRRGITNRKPHLTQYLGIDPEELLIEPDIWKLTPIPGDRFLLCSDGLTDMVKPEEIAALLNTAASAKDAVAALTNAAMDHGGRDNVTIIVVILRES